MNQENNDGCLLAEQESDSPIIKMIRILGIALVIILGMLIASGIFFNAFVVQAISP